MEILHQKHNVLHCKNQKHKKNFAPNEQKKTHFEFVKVLNALF